MKSFSVVLILTLIIAAGFGCRTRSASDADTANANAGSQPQFADAGAALAEGNRLLDENQTEDAIAVYKQAVALDPDLGEAHFKLGVAYSLLEMQLEQTGTVTQPEANADGKRAGRTNSERAFEKAVEAYEKWLKTNPNDDMAHYYLGRTYSKLLRDDQAEEEFRRAVKLKPGDTEYQTELGAVLIKLAKYHEAIGPLKRAIELDGTNDRAIAMLEDAEAGRQRVDYVAKSNSNQANANKASNSNSNANSSSNSNSAPPPANTRPAGNSKPGPPREVPRNRFANPPANRPNRPN